MGAVFYLGADWPQWKPLDIPGTHLPFSEAAAAAGVFKDNGVCSD